MVERQVPLRIIVDSPPGGVVFAVQRGRGDLHQPTRSSSEALSFDFAVRARSADDSGGVRLLGLFVQGPPGGRFAYVSSGTYAGDSSSCWGRRAKVPLTGITADLVEALEATPGAWLEARIAGTAADGGPACATVALLGQGWCLVRAPAPR